MYHPRTNSYPIVNPQNGGYVKYWTESLFHTPYECPVDFITQPVVGTSTVICIPDPSVVKKPVQKKSKYVKL